MKGKFELYYEWFNVHPKHEYALQESALEQIVEMLQRAYIKNEIYKPDFVGNLRDCIRVDDSDDKGVNYKGKWWFEEKQL